MSGPACFANSSENFSRFFLYSGSVFILCSCLVLVSFNIANCSSVGFKFCFCSLSGIIYTSVINICLYFNISVLIFQGGFRNTFTLNERNIISARASAHALYKNHSLVGLIFRLRLKHIPLRRKIKKRLRLRYKLLCLRRTRDKACFRLVKRNTRYSPCDSLSELFRALDAHFCQLVFVCLRRFTQILLFCMLRDNTV